METASSGLLLVILGRDATWRLTFIGPITAGDVGEILKEKQRQRDRVKVGAEKKNRMVRAGTPLALRNVSPPLSTEGERSS